jgi:hypothetical protein
MSNTNTSLSAQQQQALDVVAREGGLDLVGVPFDQATATFCVSLEDGEVLDFASPEGLQAIAAYSLASVDEYLAEVAAYPEEYGVRIVGWDDLA